VRSLAVDGSGCYLVSGGADSQVRVWDVRTFRPLHAYFSAQPASSLDVSQRGMLAVGYGPHVQVWQGALSEKAKAPYLNHLVAQGGQAVQAARFCPYDDVLGVGHAGGFSSLLVRSPPTARFARARPHAQARPPGGWSHRRRVTARNVTHRATTRRAQARCRLGTDRGRLEPPRPALPSRTPLILHSAPHPCTTARRSPGRASPTTTPSWPTRSRRASRGRRRRCMRCWTSCPPP
jgi:BING4CT (NUC141) domain